MSDDFEQWTRAEIAIAQARVDEMERALALFLTWRRRGVGVSNDRSASVRTEGDAPGYSGRQVERAPRTRASKNDAIFAAFEAAGPNGLSQEDVARVARDAGLNQNANALRALCWQAKKAGRLISLAPGRYAIAPKNEAAAENPPGETAAPAREPNNQHREGDAGGGI